MKKFLPWLVLILAIAYLASGLREPKQPSAYDVHGFGHFPVLLNGRIKPLDTVARTTLLTFQDRQRVKIGDGQYLLPIEWLLDVAFRPDRADGYPTFKIDNPDVLTLVGKTEESIRINYTSTAQKVLAVMGFIPTKQRRFSYAEIHPHLAELEKQAQMAQAVDAQGRNPFQKAVLSLYANLITYQQLKYSFVVPESKNFLMELRDFQAALPKGVEAVRRKQAGQPHDEAVAQQMIQAVQQFEVLSRFGSLITVPAAQGQDANAWRKTGQALLETFSTGEINTTALTYAALSDAWKNGKPEQFNELVKRYRAYIEGTLGERMDKSEAEVRFNHAEPFWKSMILFALCAVVAVVSWVRWPEGAGRAGYYIMAVAFAGTTAGILTRMWLEGRPPVTNLYSSALFVGWAAVALCLILERIYENGVGTVAGGLIGFCALIIAHHLSLGGDTLEMMRAVLDSNFWLATHVVVITLGYAATFLAGFLAIIYIVMGLFTGWLPRAFDRRSAYRAASPATAPAPAGSSKKAESNGEAIARMVYAIVCFATLFSLVGTILGGIWADQSWGRFWGWDPKENGALIIVLWNALILHARWGGLVKARGLMCLTVFGNVVTAWSWFGTNMLGIGLHSYGFMDKAFHWLIAFIAAQLVIIAIGALVPLHRWRSFAKG
jgi:cytochrome c-type biogenesis protein CcsB